MDSPTKNLAWDQAFINQSFDSLYKENQTPLLYLQASPFDKAFEQSFTRIDSTVSPTLKNINNNADELVVYPINYSDYNESIQDLRIPFNLSPSLLSPNRDPNMDNSVNQNINIDMSPTRHVDLSNINTQTFLQLGNNNMNLNSDFYVSPTPQTPNLNYTEPSTNSISPNTLARFSRFLDLNYSPTYTSASPTDKHVSPTFATSTPPPLLSFPTSPLKNTVPVAGELLYLQPPLPLMGFDNLQKQSKFSSSVTFDNDFPVGNDPFVDQKTLMKVKAEIDTDISNSFRSPTSQFYQELPPSLDCNDANNPSASPGSSISLIGTNISQDTSRAVLSMVINANLPETEFTYSYEESPHGIDITNDNSYNQNTSTNNFALSYDCTPSNSPAKSTHNDHALHFADSSPLRHGTDNYNNNNFNITRISSHGPSYNATPSPHSSPAKSIREDSIRFSPTRRNRIVKSESGIAWKNVITAPLDKTSADIIKSQLQAPQSNRKTTLVPGQLDVYMIGPTPEGRFICIFPDCGKEFGRKYNIRSHIQTHLSDRPYKCDICESRFVRQHDLKRHMKIHVEAKPHECRCGKTFARQDALTRHRARMICVGGLEILGKVVSPNKSVNFTSQAFELGESSLNDIDENSNGVPICTQPGEEGTSQVNYHEVLLSTLHQY